MNGRQGDNKVFNYAQSRQGQRETVDIAMVKPGMITLPCEEGNTWISGGEFGAEASILTVILCTSVGLYFMRRAIAKGNILKPSWRRPLQ